MRRNPKRPQEYESNTYVILDEKVVQNRYNGSSKQVQRGSAKQIPEVVTPYKDLQLSAAEDEEPKNEAAQQAQKREIDKITKEVAAGLAI